MQSAVLRAAWSPKGVLALGLERRTAAIFVPVQPDLRRRDRRAIALVLLSALCFASLAILVLLALRTGTELLVILQWRFALAAGALLLLVNRDARLPLSRWAPLVIAGMIGQAAVTFTSLSALHFIPPAALTFLFFTYPAWLAVAGAVTRMRPLNQARVIALALALAGITVMLRPGTQDLLDLRGVGLGLGAALLYAAYLPTISKLQTGVPALTAAFYIVLGAAISCTIAAAVTAGTMLPANERAWALIGVLAIVSTVLAFAFLISGVSVLGAVRTSIVGTAEPFFTAILAALVLGDRLRVTTIAGGTLIAVAVVVNARAAGDRYPGAPR